MAAKYPSEQPSGLNCPKCLKKMTEPRALQCFHLFCQTCIDDMKPTEEEKSARSLECPICEEVTPKDQVQPMKIVQELLELVSGTRIEEMKCSQCKTKVPTKRCLDCKANFCSECQEAHNKWAMLAHHQWEELPETPLPVLDKHTHCKKHPQEHIKLYCKDCKVMVCLLCNGTEHKTHEAATIDDAVQSAKKVTLDKKAKIQALKEEQEKCLSEVTSQGEDAKKK